MAVSSVAQTPDAASPVELDAAFNQWVTGLTEAQIPNAISFLQTTGTSTELAADLTGRLIRHWAESDLTAAEAWVIASPAGPAHDLALDNLAITWASQDLSKASTWALALANAADRNAALLAVANEAVRTQPQVALKLAMNVAASPARDELVLRAAMEYATMDQPSALQWAKQIPDQALRTQIFSRIALAWAKSDPSGAGNFVMQNLPTGRLHDDTMIGIAQRWAEIDPQKAAAWAGALPSAELRSTTLESVLAVARVSTPQ